MSDWGTNPPPATNERHCRNAVAFACLYNLNSLKSALRR